LAFRPFEVRFYSGFFFPRVSSLVFRCRTTPFRFLDAVLFSPGPTPLFARGRHSLFIPDSTRRFTSLKKAFFGRQKPLASSVSRHRTGSLLLTPGSPFWGVFSRATVLTARRSLSPFAPAVVFFRDNGPPRCVLPLFRGVGTVLPIVSRANDSAPHLWPPLLYWGPQRS